MTKYFLYQDCNVYILYHRMSEIYCYGSSKDEAFGMIPKDYTKNRNPNDLVELQKQTLEDFVKGDMTNLIKGVDDD